MSDAPLMQIGGVAKGAATEIAEAGARRAGPVGEGPVPARQGPDPGPPRRAEAARLVKTWTFIDDTRSTVVIKADAVVFEPQHVVFYDGRGRIVAAVFASRISLMQEIGNEGTVS